MMRFLLIFLRFYNIISEVLKINVVGVVGTNIWLVPPHSEAGVGLHISRVRLVPTPVDVNNPSVSKKAERLVAEVD